MYSTQVVVGDLFAANAEAYVNAVNCKGVMGAGIAREFRERWPRYFRDYRRACQAGLLQPGGVLPWSNPASLLVPQSNADPRYILSLATKDDWHDATQLAWIRDGLVNLKRCTQELGIASVALPAIGCGLGGLRWSDVYREILNAFRYTAEQPTADVRVLIYPPR